MIRGYKSGDEKTIMDKEYLGHAVFSFLDKASRFYNDLAENVMCFMPKWVKSHPIVNYDSYFFEALANSIVSIKTILELGHITDAKALLRNFFDETIVNLYFMARLKRKDNDLSELLSRGNFFGDGFKIGEFYDVNTSDWLLGNKTKGLQRTLHYDEMLKYLKQEVSIAGIVDYLDSSECKKRREWLNDAVHFNYYKAVLLNDGLLCIDDLRKSTLEEFQLSFNQITMFHTTCVFCIQPIYMMSSDYIDYKDCGMEPPEGCQYNVSPFVQSYLDATVYKVFPNWAEKLVEVARPMRLNKVEK